MKIVRTSPARFAHGKRALTAMAVGTMATLVLVEATFFLLGKMHPRLVRPPTVEGKFNILCLGNSYTAGTGAPPGHSYCDYLQRRLSTHPVYSLYGARVINLGQRSFNSHEVRAMLPREIERYRPLLILAMTGEPNYWNRVGIETFRAGGPLSIWKLPFAKLMALARKTGTYRFLSLLLGGFQEQIATKPLNTFASLRENRAGLTKEEVAWSIFGLLYPSTNLFSDVEKLSDADVTFAIEWLSPLAQGPSGTFTLANVLARLHLFGKGDHAKAIDWYRRAILMARDIFPVDTWADLTLILPALTPEEKPEFEALRRELAARAPPAPALANALEGENSTQRLASFSVVPKPTPERVRRIADALRFRPADWALTRLLAENYTNMNRPLDAVSSVRNLLLENPLSNPPYLPGFILWSKRDTLLQAPAVRTEIDRLQTDFLRRYPSKKFAFETIAEDEIDRWVADDLRGLAQLAQSSGAQLVLQTYPPMRNPTEVRRADTVIQRLAAAEHLTLSDTLAYFNQRFADGLERETIYSNDFGKEDSHLNAEGYRELADFLLKSLEREELLRPDHPLTRQGN